MPEPRPEPPADLVYQARDKDSPPYERAAAQAELDGWYQRTYADRPAGEDPAPPTAAPASAALLGETPPGAPPPPPGGTPDRYTPPSYIGDGAVPPDLREAVGQAVGELGMPQADVIGLEERYQVLATDARDAPSPEAVMADLARWHGEARSREVLAAAQAAAEEALKRWPSMRPMLGVLGSDAYAISVIGLAKLRARE